MLNRKACLIVLAVVLVAAGQVYAGNAVITGHDSDFHASFGGVMGQAQVNAGLAFVRAGADDPTDKVLIFTNGVAGNDLQTAVTNAGVLFDEFNINGGVPGAPGTLLDATVYSAILLSSNIDCGGCDLTVTGADNMEAISAEIATFFNAGGGIFAFSAADDLTYYNFLPAAAPGTVIGDPTTSGYTQTAFGALHGIPDVNGDPTHNVFPEPGVGGVDPLWMVVERHANSVSPGNTGNAPVTLGIEDATIGGGGGFEPAIPEPSTLLLLAVGLGSLGLIQLRRKNQKSL